MNSKKKILLIIAFILIVITIISPRMLNFLENALGKMEKEMILLNEFELPHSSQIKYAKLDQQLIQYWDGILYAYRINGEQSWSINLGITNPTIISYGENAYIIDNNKKQIHKINKLGETVYSVILKDSIEDIKICDEGYVLIYYTPDKGPLRSFEILDNKGKKYGELLISEGEIINSTISGREGRVLVYTTNVVQGGIEGNLLEFNLKGNLLGSEKQGDRIPLFMKFDTKKNTVIIYDNEIVSIDQEKQRNWSNKVESVHHIAMEADDVIALHLSKVTNNSLIQGRGKNKIVLYDMNGKFLGEKAFEENIKGVDTFQNEILGYSDRTIYLLDKKAEQQMQYKYNSDIEKAFLYQQKHVVVVTKEKLAFFKIQ